MRGGVEGARPFSITPHTPQSPSGAVDASSEQHNATFTSTSKTTSSSTKDLPLSVPSTSPSIRPPAPVVASSFPTSASTKVSTVGDLSASISVSPSVKAENSVVASSQREVTSPIARSAAIIPALPSAPAPTASIASADVVLSSSEDPLSATEVASGAALSNVTEAPPSTSPGRQSSPSVAETVPMLSSLPTSSALLLAAKREKSPETENAQKASHVEQKAPSGNLRRAVSGLSQPTSHIPTFTSKRVLSREKLPTETTSKPVGGEKIAAVAEVTEPTIEQIKEGTEKVHRSRLPVRSGGQSQSSLTATKHPSDEKMSQSKIPKMTSGYRPHQYFGQPTHIEKSGQRVTTYIPIIRTGLPSTQSRVITDL
ncbi:unnamed protein product [Toxocara canis]|uniref:Flocculation protein FLO11-like n=1 Tax=Toxocara canis TaxID=6265 RepID=A0A183VF79_TOXCA|nr:unnamed protein product [Toxocara canis]